MLFVSQDTLFSSKEFWKYWCKLFLEYIRFIISRSSSGFDFSLNTIKLSHGKRMDTTVRLVLNMTQMCCLFNKMLALPH